jgi:hypothetical protein
MGPRPPRRLIVITLVALVVLPAGAMARGTANDLSPSLSYSALVSAPSGRSTETLSFALNAYVSWDGGDASSIELTVTLPAGLHWAGSPAGCVPGASGATCTKAITPTSGTNLAAAFPTWRVVADRAGTYTVETSVESALDGNASNNTGSLSIPVSTKVTGVALRPRAPKAGSTVVASHPLYVTSADRTFAAAEASVRCQVKIGTKAVAAKGTHGGGKSSCTFRTPATARGKVVTGTVRSTSGGLVLNKQFRVKLR